MIFVVICHATINTPNINICQLKQKSMNIAVTWDRNDVSVRACCDCKYEVSYSAKRVTRVLISRIQKCFERVEGR